eukprot:TRINITY_DN17181_c0_g1_i1.p1 TRINITY_DN17181_c0_g1~~TRINITY_DN17181_c0_g1_i1.p1  ORF type:complete len:443 (-),score=149.07 TRINITY_DN17181_c0_g1_i1:43-1182(-)
MSHPKSIRRKQIEKFFNKKKEEKNKKIDKVWHLEDANGGHQYDGHTEGQNSAYVIFAMEGSDFRVYGLDEWYSFRPRKSYALRKLTVEEAEAAMAGRNAKVDRVMADKYNMKKEEEPAAPGEEEEDKPKFGGAQIKEEDDGFSTFGGLDFDQEKLRKRVKKERGSDDEEDVDAIDMDELEDKEQLDFEGKVSDDEEPDKPEDDESEEEKRKDFGEGSDEEGKDLTEEGKSMRKILAKIEKEEDPNKSDSEDEGEKFNISDMEIRYGGKREDSRPPAPSDPSPTKEGTKRTAEGEPDQTPPGKAPKTKSIDEEEVRKQLLLLGKVQTKQLIGKFKNQLIDEHSKRQFAMLVKKLARIHDDPDGKKYLIIKDEYKYKPLNQ